MCILPKLSVAQATVLVSSKCVQMNCDDIYRVCATYIARRVQSHSRLQEHFVDRSYRRIMMLQNT